MYAFDYVRPESLAHAIEALADDDAVPLSGGQTLLPTLKQRLAMPRLLVDIRRLEALQGIEADSGSLSIGAGMTHDAVAGSEEVQASIPSLAALAGGIGDPQVRNLGTIGGSLANNDPAADYPAAVLALDATVVTSRREIPADAFFQGLFTTSLESGELITGVRFRIPEAAAYCKFDQPASRFALTGVFVARMASGDVRVAVTGASGEGVFRHEGLEAALGASFRSEAVDEVSISSEGLMDDLHGFPEYRANLIKVMASRAVVGCA